MMIRKRMIKDCPVTANDVKRYYEIYGDSEGAVKGKKTRKRPDEVTTDNLVELPKHVLKQHKELTLCADLFFIDGFPYMTTISKGIMFTTVEMMENRKFDTLLDGLLRVIAFYKVKGFKINYIFSDNEFKAMKDALQDGGKVDLNCSAPNEHVQAVERNIKTIKERVRSLIHGMPYKRLPKNFKRELIITCITMLNAIPRRASISTEYSPREMVEGKALDFNKHCRVAPGDYCLVHEERLATNTMEPRALRAMAIGPDNNIQGSFRFLMLDTARVVTRRQWRKMTVTDEVIDKMHELAKDENERVEILYRGTFYTTADEDGTETDEDPSDSEDEDNVQSDAEDETRAPPNDRDDEVPRQADAEIVKQLDPVTEDVPANRIDIPAPDNHRMRRSRRI